MKNINIKNILINGLTFITWFAPYSLTIFIIKTGIENNMDIINKIMKFLEDTQAGDYPEIAVALCVAGFIGIGILHLLACEVLYKAIHSKVSAITELVINLLNKPNKQEQTQRGRK